MGKEVQAILQCPEIWQQVQALQTQPLASSHGSQRARVCATCRQQNQPEIPILQRQVCYAQLLYCYVGTTHATVVTELALRHIKYYFSLEKGTEKGAGLEALQTA